MKKLVGKTAILTSVLFLGVAIGEKNETVKAKNSDYTVGTKSNGKNIKKIDTKQVTIEYIESDEFFDILITPKDNYNVSSEFENKVGEHYKDFYIVGTSKEKAQKFYKSNDMKQKGVKWTWDK